jgi:hypothetical protein
MMDDAWCFLLLVLAGGGLSKKRPFSLVVNDAFNFGA